MRYPPLDEVAKWFARISRSLFICRECGRTVPGRDVRVLDMDCVDGLIVAVCRCGGLMESLPAVSSTDNVSLPDGQKSGSEAK
jgi:hypothetical protein